ncbi:MAG: helix-turn-helix transcriptional regulator [Blautia sp.]|nr:helix-turn-helix transcriptional regulator [Blautia sp.]
MPEQKKNWGSTFGEMFLKDYPVRETEKRQVLSLDDSSRIYICRLWDGIYLWANEVHSSHIAYPEYDFQQLEYTVINICHAGRCEIEMRDDSYIYMTPGLLNVNNLIPKDGYHYPGSFYEGIEVALNLRILRKHMPAELSSFGMTLEALEQYLETGNGNYMANVVDMAMQRSRALYERLKAGDLSIQDYRFLTVSLLYYLKNGEAARIRNQSMVTKGQRRIAVEAEQLLTEDYRKHYSVEELSRRYGVSPSAFKKYFEAVFGAPVSYYLREKRMKKAMEMLAASDASVGETAAVCGYENQSKFGAVFKSCTGVSPLEYRRLHRTV